MQLSTSWKSSLVLFSNHKLCNMSAKLSKLPYDKRYEAADGKHCEDPQLTVNVIFKAATGEGV